MTVHCAALAKTLLESELFGHEKRNFTGADRRCIGRFEQAHGGTLFLDEIGEIPQSIQVKLLRVLQERPFERVGGSEPVKVDVRLIAATSKNRSAEVEAGRSREDLFYRLNVVHVEMPPLRAHGNDVLTLAQHFIERFSKENDKALEGFTDRALAKLRAHHWPGNVRELENAVGQGFVAVGDEGAMLVLAALGAGACRVLGLTAEMCVRRLEDEHRAYLAWHRAKVFRRPDSLPLDEGL